MLSKEVSSAFFFFFFFFFDGLPWDWTQVFRTISEHSNHYANLCLKEIDVLHLIFSHVFVALYSESWMICLLLFLLLLFLCFPLAEIASCSIYFPFFNKIWVTVFATPTDNFLDIWPNGGNTSQTAASIKS